MDHGRTPQFPPPGAPPPEEPSAPHHAEPGEQFDETSYPRHRAEPSYDHTMRAAHKPGAIPLRPLTLGSIYDGAFRIIRFNPQSTVGAAVLVTAIANVVPIALTALLTFTVGVSFADTMGPEASAGEEFSNDDLAGLLLILLALAAGGLATWFGLVFVTGMVAHVARAAAVGRRLSLPQAWAATHGTRWRLVGLNLLLTAATFLVLAVYTLLLVSVAFAVGEVWVVVLLGLLTGVGLVCAMFWFWIRVYYLPVPVLMLERTGVLAAITRGFRLTHGQFWRTFGIALLTLLITSVAAQVFSVPFSLVGQLLALVGGDYGWLILVGMNAVASVLINAFVAPFTSAVVSLQYLDQRIRKEAHDVELMAEAGLLGR